MTEDQRSMVRWVRTVIRERGGGVLIREQVLEVLEKKYPRWTAQERFIVWRQALIAHRKEQHAKA